MKTTISVRDGHVVVYNHAARLVFAFSWRAAIEIAHSMMWKARGIEAPDSQKVAAVQVRRVNDDIVLEHLNGKVFAVWPLSHAHTIGEIMIAKARGLETKEKADQIAFDQAILFRSGKRFGLTSDPDIQHVAGNLAAWDSSLRRYLPGGIRGQEQFGAPTLVRGRAVAFSARELGFALKLLSGGTENG
jgi:hypothetical protein